MTMKPLKLYHLWVADKHCNPIENTDEMVYDTSMRDLLEYKSIKLGVPYCRNNKILRLPDGNFLCVMFIKELK